MPKVEEPTVLFGKSKWIWAGEVSGRSSDVILRKTVTLDRPPTRAVCRAACDTHYYLFVNGAAAVWHGGLNRGKSAYYDEFDISKYLTKGTNVIVAYCRYYGTAGRDLVPGPRAGFIFECNDLEVYSDGTFTAYENVAYRKPAIGNCCYAGSDILYDASREEQIQNHLETEFTSSLFVPATELDAYPDAVNGTLLPRPTPLERFSPQPIIGKVKKVSDPFGDDTYTIQLPRMMRVTPYFEVTGSGNEKITVTTDRTNCGGTFGDEGSTYRAHSVEYITKPTVNMFEALLPMTGETLIFTMPRTVKVLKLGYRELGYNTAPTCEFAADDMTETLFGKAEVTLYNCMDSTLIDTPERERTMWLGDSSIAARALYLAYADAAPLVKKLLDDVYSSAVGDTLLCCVPGNVPVDIPSHGLLALGEYGLYAQYRNFVGDLDLFKTNYERLCDYLMLWEMTENGVLPREGNRRWYDNLYNIDEALLENALYYSACKFLRQLGAELGEHEYDETFDDRMDNIADYIESCWDGLGYTTRDSGYDDRANAFVALCGLVPQERKQAVARLLAAVNEASPYMEWAVIQALCELGYRRLAYMRFVSRYSLAARSEDSTLGEDFCGFGTKCQSYQTAVIPELVQMFGGIDVRKGATEIDITPDLTTLADFRCVLKLATGELDVRYKYGAARADIIIDNRTSGKVTLVIDPENIGRKTDRKTVVLGKGKNKFAI